MDRPLMTIREILLERLRTYEEEVRSGRHVPPPRLKQGDPQLAQESPPED
jgi:hypothetical protein